jgi:hypothetical protein
MLPALLSHQWTDGKPKIQTIVEKSRWWEEDELRASLSAGGL